MALVAAGLTNDEIAERLFVSPATAKTHVSRAMTKLGARDRAQLVVFAYESGLVRPGWSGSSAFVGLSPTATTAAGVAAKHPPGGRPSVPEGGRSGHVQHTARPQRRLGRWSRAVDHFPIFWFAFWVGLVAFLVTRFRRGGRPPWARDTGCPSSPSASPGATSRPTSTASGVTS